MQISLLQCVLREQKNDPDALFGEDDIWGVSLPYRHVWSDENEPQDTLGFLILEEKSHE